VARQLDPISTTDQGKKDAEKEVLTSHGYHRRYGSLLLDLHFRTWMSVGDRDERLTHVREVCAKHTCVWVWLAVAVAVAVAIAVRYLNLEAWALILYIHTSSWTGVLSVVRWSNQLSDTL